MRKNQSHLLLLALVLSAVLGACAPAVRETPRATVDQLSRSVGFYPDQTGARWEYLPADAPLDDAKLVQQVEGPRVVDGRTLISHLTRGAGAEERKFRSIDSQGVLLYARSVPGAQTTFDPPIREFPAPGGLRRGANWSGTTTATTFFPAAKPEDRLETRTVRYSYTVVDRRSVRVTAGTFDVYVLNLVTDELGEGGTAGSSMTQELWYSPYVGEIRTVGGYYLTGLNFEPVYPE